MRARDRILVVLYVVLAMLPTLAMLFHWKDRDLAGSLEPVRRPRLGIWKVTSEKFQTGFTKWYERNLGYRNYAVVADNTLLYHLFGETKLYAHVVVGKDHVLFERDDINLLNKGGPSREQVDALADRIAMLQARLRLQHRAFVPVLVPSKTSIYRDAVPAKWRLHPEDPMPSDEIYSMTKRALDARSIEYVDVREMLTARGVERALVWSPQARHWSDYGACLAMERIARSYSKLAEKTFEFPCHLDVGKVLRGHDNYDLMRLLNVWKAPHARTHGRVTFGPPTPGPTPRVLFISSSFGWQIERVAEESNRFSELWLDYYDWILYGRPMGVEIENLSVDTAQWRDVFLKEDLYVYELFETYLYADEKFTRVLDKLLTALPSAP